MFCLSFRAKKDDPTMEELSNKLLLDSIDELTQAAQQYIKGTLSLDDLKTVQYRIQERITRYAQAQESPAAKEFVKRYAERREEKS